MTPSGSRGSTARFRSIGTLVTLTDTAPTDHIWNFAAVEILPMQRVAPPIIWPVPADIVYDAPLDDLQLNATTDVAGTFVYSPPAGTILNAGPNQTLLVTFTPSSTTTIYGPATATVPLNVLKAPTTRDVGVSRGHPLRDAARRQPVERDGQRAGHVRLLAFRRHDC